MFKGHPKGLFVAFFTNMGERFGYYTMLAIFVLYLQAKFGWTETKTGNVYGFFMFGIYFLPLLGGIVADNLLGYGKTIVLGTIVMFLGYGMLATPAFANQADLGMGNNFPYFIFAALAVVSLGTGFFKGNLQALVGNMYDDPKYGKLRDSAFLLFYMGINIGAFFAPSAAQAARNWMLEKHGLAYNSKAADLSHKYLDGSLQEVGELMEIATSQMGDAFTNLTEFSQSYISAIGQGYNAGFGVAALSMILSFIIFISFRKYYKKADVTHKQTAKASTASLPKLSKSEYNTRLVALGLVFLVVIFFWMAFHQNGFTLTVFARDYTVENVPWYTAIFFNLKSFLPLILAIIGMVLMFGKNNTRKTKISGMALLLGGAIVTYWATTTYSPTGNDISPELFQQFNPIFIVFLTPLIIGMFDLLRKKGKEPSSPKKIGIGMIITAIGFLLLVVASFGLPSPNELDQGFVVDQANLRSPYWLISTYFTLTIAELFLSPIGISFVSKVAPPQLKGLAQGGWFGATAIGNLIAGFIGRFWDSWELWQFFLLLVVLCILSAIFIFSVLKKLERATV